jgi:hypothetical protein
LFSKKEKRKRARDYFSFSSKRAGMPVPTMAKEEEET